MIPIIGKRQALIEFLKETKGPSTGDQFKTYTQDTLDKSKGFIEYLQKKAAAEPKEFRILKKKDRERAIMHAGFYRILYCAIYLSWHQMKTKHEEGDLDDYTFGIGFVLGQVEVLTTLIPALLRKNNLKIFPKELVQDWESCEKMFSTFAHIYTTYYGLSKKEYEHLREILNITHFTKDMMPAKHSKKHKEEL